MRPIIPPTNRSAAFVCCMCVSLSLAACRPAPPPLPSGVQTVSGKVERVGISLHRRGTHLLRQGEAPLYYLESTTESLYSLEGREVTLQGILEANTDPHDLPVLVVQKVTKGVDEPVRTWTARPLNISLDVPRSWTATLQRKTAEFTASGSELPVLRITIDKKADLPLDFQSLTASGTDMTMRPLLIGTHKAVAVTGEKPQRWMVHVDASSDAKSSTVITLSFLVVSSSSEPAMQIMAFEKIAHSLVFLVSATGTGKTVTPSGSGSVAADGKPCGGPAGILCPGGYACQITDVESNVGRCKKF